MPSRPPSFLTRHSTGAVGAGSGGLALTHQSSSRRVVSVDSLDSSEDDFLPAVSLETQNAMLPRSSSNASSSSTTTSTSAREAVATQNSIALHPSATPAAPPALLKSAKPAPRVRSTPLLQLNLQRRSTPYIPTSMVELLYATAATVAAVVRPAEAVCWREKEEKMFGVFTDQQNTLAKHPATSWKPTRHSHWSESDDEEEEYLSLPPPPALSMSRASSSTVASAAPAAPEPSQVFRFLEDWMVLAAYLDGPKSVPAPCMTLALVYLTRFMSLSKCPVTAGNWRTLILTSLVIARKVWSEKALSRTPVELLPAQEPRWSRIERQFLELMQYQLDVDRELYAKYFGRLQVQMNRMGEQIRGVSPVLSDVEAEHLERRSKQAREWFFSSPAGKNVRDLDHFPRRATYRVLAEYYATQLEGEMDPDVTSVVLEFLLPATVLGRKRMNMNGGGMFKKQNSM
jgi:hypothetical protein